MQKLGRNSDGYYGERLPVDATLQRLRSAAERFGWKPSSSPVAVGTAGYPFLAYHRASRHTRFRFYFSSGIHGDEPAGPLAVARLLEEDQWPEGVELWCCPCLNPRGLEANSRTTIHGIDLNRDYRVFRSPETRRHAAWLLEQPRFDLGLCLHEDWESKGFYLYEVNPDSHPPLAEGIIQKVAEVCPIDHSPVIDGWPAHDGIVRPRIHPRDRPEWAESAFLLANRTRLTCTLEAPSDFPLETRIHALVVAVRAALNAALASKTAAPI